MGMDRKFSTSERDREGTGGGGELTEGVVENELLTVTDDSEGH